MRKVANFGKAAEIVCDKPQQVIIYVLEKLVEKVVPNNHGLTLIHLSIFYKYHPG